MIQGTLFGKKVCEAFNETKRMGQWARGWWIVRELGLIYQSVPVLLFLAEWWRINGSRLVFSYCLHSSAISFRRTFQQSLCYATACCNGCTTPSLFLHFWIFGPPVTAAVLVATVSKAKFSVVVEITEFPILMCALLASLLTSETASRIRLFVKLCGKFKYLSNFFLNLALVAWASNLSNKSNYCQILFRMYGI